MDVQLPCNYLALSYVWGKSKVFTLRQENQLRLRDPGSLKSRWADLPATVRNAIRLTSKMGERYLWIDSLCIVQDDLAEKQSLIPFMDTIYNNAAVTIVAASATTADSGLPGVGRKQRCPQLVQEVAPGVVLISQKSVQDMLEMSHYESRAWTWVYHSVKMPTSKR